MKPRVLFLYTELAPYITQCFEAINGFEVYVIHYPLNKEAPFKDMKQNEVDYLEIKPDDHFDKLNNLIREIAPKIIFCSGWSDKKYLKVKKSFKTPFVLCFDTPIRHTIQQKLKILYFRKFLKNEIKAVWVPGKAQLQLAQKMGFKFDDIFTGFYVAVKNDNIHPRYQNKPLKIFYLGRYVKQKNIQNLWQAIAEINSNELIVELHAYGTGALSASAPRNIKGLYHHGFLHKSEFKKVLRDYQFNILPSTFEPWGVGLQDVLLMGFPVICSQKVMAAQYFKGDHLIMLNDLDTKGLVDGINKAIEVDENEFNLMSQSALNSGASLKVEDWVTTFEKIYHKFVL